MSGKVDDISLAEAGMFYSPRSRGTRPENFAEVVPGLYRSAYPEDSNFGYLKTLKLKTIVTLVDKTIPEGYQNFLAKNDINHRVFGMTGTKKEKIPDNLMIEIQDVITNTANYPLMVHCNHGKHRTGCVIALFQQMVGASPAYSAWDLAYSVQQYEKYAQPKVRPTDIEYITTTNPRVLLPQYVLDRARAIGNSLPCGLGGGRPKATRANHKWRRTFVLIFVTFIMLFCLSVAMNNGDASAAMTASWPLRTDWKPSFLLGGPPSNDADPPSDGGL